MIELNKKIEMLQQERQKKSKRLQKRKCCAKEIAHEKEKEKERALSKKEMKNDQ